MYKTEIALDGGGMEGGKSFLCTTARVLNYKTCKIIGDQRRRFRNTSARFFI